MATVGQRLAPDVSPQHPREVNVGCAVYCHGVFDQDILFTLRPPATKECRKDKHVRPKTLLTAVCLVFIGAASIFSQDRKTSPRRTLDIYYVDVEGGAATLIVTPAGESVLIDAGWPGFDGRDAKR